MTRTHNDYVYDTALARPRIVLDLNLLYHRYHHQYPVSAEFSDGLCQN